MFIYRLAAALLLFPVTAMAWSPGPSQPDAVSGLGVDRDRRNDVLGFHRNIYAASAGYAARMAWTGSDAGLNEGTTSPDYVNDVQRRINYYRALAGVPANITLNDGSLVVVGLGDLVPPAGTTKQAAAQRAALMFSLALFLNYVTGVVRRNGK